jgi:hypothetical protein
MEWQQFLKLLERHWGMDPPAYRTVVEDVVQAELVLVPLVEQIFWQVDLFGLYSILLTHYGIF